MKMNLSLARDIAREHVFWCKSKGITAEEILTAVGYQGTKRRDWITAYDVLTHLSWVMNLKKERAA